MKIFHANIDISGTSEKVNFEILKSLKYLDTSRITDDEIEIGIGEVDGEIILATITVENSHVTDLNLYAPGLVRLYCCAPFWKPIIKEAWRQHGIDIEKIESKSVTLDSFVGGLLGREDCQIKWIKISVHIPGTNKRGVLVCSFACGTFTGCYTTIVPEPEP